MGSVTRCELVAHHLEVGFVVVNDEEHWLLHGHHKPIGDPTDLGWAPRVPTDHEHRRDPTGSVAGARQTFERPTPSLGLSER